jgi:hypothetical protein
VGGPRKRSGWPMHAEAIQRGLRATSRAVAATVIVSLAYCGAPTLSDSRGAGLERVRKTLSEAQEELDERHLERAAALYRQAGDEASALGDPSLPLARALDGLADVHRLAGRPADAADLYLRSAAMWETLLGDRQPRLATTLPGNRVPGHGPSGPGRAAPAPRARHLGGDDRACLAPGTRNGPSDTKERGANTIARQTLNGLRSTTGPLHGDAHHLLADPERQGCVRQGAARPGDLDPDHPLVRGLHGDFDPVRLGLHA